MIDLATIVLFEGLEDRRAQNMARVFEQRKLAAGQVVFHEGDASDSLVVVLDGLMELYREGAAGETHLADVGPGRVLGTTSLIDAGPRSASLRAYDDATIAVLDKETFQTLWSSDGDTASRLLRQMALVAISELQSGQRRLLESLSVPIDSQLQLGNMESDILACVYQAGYLRQPTG